MVEKRNLTLGELIEKLEQCSNDKELYFDFGGMIPIYVDSWRGDYSELAITYEHVDKAKPKTVGEFLEILKNAVGSTFFGYKGGYYTMHKHTKVWVSNYGEAYETAVIDVIELSYCVMLLTSYVPYDPSDLYNRFRYNML